MSDRVPLAHDAAAAPSPFIGNAYAQLPEVFYSRPALQPVRAPSMVLRNRALAESINGMSAWLDRVEAPATLSGNVAPDGTDPLAIAYSGHQFGHWVPLLGDGRALMLGQVRTHDGSLLDLQLKGSGRTLFSRGGDGRATLGSAIREYIICEAMSGLCIPTTRSLAVCTTGEFVMRESPEPGAVLTRLARSHLRVGSFQYAAAQGDVTLLRALVTHSISTLYPHLSEHAHPAQALLEAVVERQASLIAQWMLAGFIHGVMNTDNMVISGESIDYGPCAFLDEFHPQKVFSSIDRHGRYAWGQQPSIGLWNLTRFAETLLPLLADDEAEAIAMATHALEAFSPRFASSFAGGLHRKLGLPPHVSDADAKSFIESTFATMATGKIDFTLFFRRLTGIAAGGEERTFRALFADDAAASTWLKAWRDVAELEQSADALDATRLHMMRNANPIFIARNHRVEAAIRAAVEQNDFAPTLRLCTALASPFKEQPEHADLETPPTPEEIVHRTFCGT